MNNHVQSRRAIAAKMSASIVLAASGFVGLGVAPTVFAATTQQATNLSQFTNLVTMLNGVNTTLSQEGTLSTVVSFANTVSAAGNSKWGPVLYGSAYVGSGTSKQNLGITFFKNMLQLFVSQIATPISASSIPALEASVTGQFQDVNTSITGTDLYNFYVDFRDSAITQILAGSSSVSGSNTLNNVIDTALSSAVSQNSVFSGILGQYGLSISDIPTIRSNFMNQFAGSQAALNDVVNAFVVPIFSTSSKTMTSGNIQTVGFTAENVGASLNNVTLPTSWLTLTSNNAAVTVSDTASGFTLTANAVTTPTTVTLSPTLRGYTLTPFQITVNPVSNGGGGGGRVVPPSGGSGSGSGGSGSGLGGSNGPTPDHSCNAF